MNNMIEHGEFKNIDKLNDFVQANNVNVLSITEVEKVVGYLPTMGKPCELKEKRLSVYYKKDVATGNTEIKKATSPIH